MCAHQFKALKKRDIFSEILKWQKGFTRGEQDIDRTQGRNVPMSVDYQ